MPTLNWIGKEAVVNHHHQVPYHLLQCDKELSAGDPDAGNLLVQGDNLLALKALLPYYAGKVKCIYIDPPYNTGKEGWVYNDNVNSPEIRRWLGQVVGPETEDLSRHDKWLCMMHPRLSLLKPFLRGDGVIVVHIDEHEHAALTLLLDELFGRQNSLGTIVWDKGNPKGDSGQISTQHEYLVCYARSKTEFQAKHGPVLIDKPNSKLMLSKSRSLCRQIGKKTLPSDLREMAKKFDLPGTCLEAFTTDYSLQSAQEEFKRWIDAEPKLTGGERQYFRLHADNTTGRYRVYRLASMAWPNKKPAPEDYFVPLVHPQTEKPCPVPARGWRFPPETFRAMLKKGQIEFGADHTVQPQQRLFLDEYLQQRLSSVIRDAKSDDDLFNALKLRFENPKPFEFVAKMIRAFSNNDDLILDSFAGSGTTAHATLLANKQDGGKRRFIAVEMDPVSTEKASVRLSAAIKGHPAIPKLKTPLDGGFRFCKLSKPLFNEAGNIETQVRYSDLAAHVFFTETGSPIPKRATGKTPLLGVHQGRAIYLLFNGVLGDNRPAGGNVLTNDVLAKLPPHPQGDGERIIYGEGRRLSVERLRREGIVFKQMPYEIKVS